MLTETYMVKDSHNCKNSGPEQARILTGTGSPSLAEQILERQWMWGRGSFPKSCGTAGEHRELWVISEPGGQHKHVCGQTHADRTHS